MISVISFINGTMREIGTNVKQLGGAYMAKTSPICRT